MKMVLSLLVVALSLTYQANADSNDYYQKLTEAVSTAEEDTGVTDNTNVTQWMVQPIGNDFPCDVIQWNKRAETIMELTPYDIDVVAALGDSLTAAFGAESCTVLTIKTEYRGVSWSIGGDDDLSKVTTLPNILKKYNPNLKGYSVGKCKETDVNSHLNMAISGSVASDMKAEAVKLVDKIKKDESIDFNNSWKLVTLFVGANDLCDLCSKDAYEHDASHYRDHIKETLDYLHDNLPRTFVNLVQIIDVTRLDELKTLWCTAIHSYACPCATTKGASSREMVSQMSTEYQEALNELIGSGIYDDKDDFTVVIQPFFIGLQIPKDSKGKADRTYFAADCFHFSTKSHKEGALGLWYNMIQPVGEKESAWKIGGPLMCPPDTNNPLIYSARNSNPQQFGDSLPSNDDGGDGGSGRSSYYSVIVSTSTVGVVVCVGTVLLVTVLVAWRVRQGRIRKINTEEFRLI